MKFIRFLIFCLILPSACVERGQVEVSGLEGATPSVTNISVKNGKLHLEGSALHSAKRIQIDNTDLSIESQSENSLIATASEALSLKTSQLFELVISNAQGSTTYPIQLVINDGDVTSAKIADGAVTASKLSDMGATTGQILKFDGTQWVASDLGSLTYSGNWDASTNSPDLTLGGVPGEYHIVSTAGSFDLNGGAGTDDWAVGDWVVWNETQTRWEKINNASNVTSFNGRSGPVNPQTGDYTWAQIDKSTAPIDDLSDVDTSSTTPTSGQVLKWDGSNWVPGADNNSGSVTDVTASSPLASSGGSTPDISLSQAGSGSDGYLSSTDWTTFNNKAEEPSVTCGASEKLTWDGTSFVCATDIDNNTNASTICSGTNYLGGDGSCYSPTTDTNTNASTDCAAGEYLDGDGTCKTAATDAGEFLADGSVPMAGTFDGGGYNLTNVGSLFTNNRAGLTLNSFGSTSGQTGELRFNDLDDTNYVGFKSPDTVSSNLVWTLPASDGSAGEALVTDNAGNLSWASSLPPSGSAGGELSGSYPNPTVSDNVIDSANLMTDSVTAAKVAAGAIGTSEIATDGVNSAEIAADAVGTSEIATDGVGSAEISTGAVNTDELASSSVTSGKIADGEIVDADVNASANITASKLGTGLISNTEFNYLDGLTGGLQTQLDSKVDISGDSMTGPLSVPANDFTVGTNQLTTVSGNVGVGTASPAETLDVNGEVKSNVRYVNKASHDISSTGWYRVAEMQSYAGLATNMVFGEFVAIYDAGCNHGIVKFSVTRSQGGSNANGISLDILNQTVHNNANYALHGIRLIYGNYGDPMYLELNIGDVEGCSGATTIPVTLYQKTGTRRPQFP